MTRLPKIVILPAACYHCPNCCLAPATLCPESNTLTFSLVQPEILCENLYKTIDTAVRRQAEKALLEFTNSSTVSYYCRGNAAASAVDVEEALTLPASPLLIVLGVIQYWMLSIEGQVVCEGVSGLAVLFASYYNFNLQYQNEATCTLEFIQRCFLGINPKRGSKTKKWTTGNPHVNTLLRKLMDFEWAS